MDGYDALPGRLPQPTGCAARAVRWGAWCSAGCRCRCAWCGYMRQWWAQAAEASPASTPHGGWHRGGNGCRHRLQRRSAEAAQVTSGSASGAPALYLSEPDPLVEAMCAGDGPPASAGAAQAPSAFTVGAPVLCLSEHDLLAEAMCVGDGPPALVVSFDPMLEELLAAAFIGSCSTEPAPQGFAEMLSVVAVLCPLASAVDAGASAGHTSSGGSSRRRLWRRGRPTRDRGDASGGGCPLASAVSAGVDAAHASSGGSARRREWQ
jgi:hypothetical protein